MILLTSLNFATRSERCFIDALCCFQTSSASSTIVYCCSSLVCPIPFSIIWPLKPGYLRGSMWTPTWIKHPLLQNSVQQHRLLTYVQNCRNNHTHSLTTYNNTHMHLKQSLTLIHYTGHQASPGNALFIASCISTSTASAFAQKTTNNHHHTHICTHSSHPHTQLCNWTAEQQHINANNTNNSHNKRKHTSPRHYRYRHRPHACCFHRNSNNNNPIHITNRFVLLLYINIVYCIV